ncbi:MAG: ABC transporter substrate-binding protein, partial [Pseudomonadota bacterium]
MNVTRASLYAGVAAVSLTAGAGWAGGHLAFAPGEGDFNWESFEAYAAANDFSGETVTITGPWTGLDAELFESVTAFFAEATGATVEYSGSDSFEQDLVIATQADTPPNIAVIPQPGLMADLAAAGELTPLGEDTAAWIGDNYAAGSSWVSLGTAAGPDGADALYGFFYKVDVKSLVWYSPEAFDEAGYDIPETMEDLLALSDQIVADGGTPWCIGLGSGAATGWPATDWVEDIMLRTQPPEVYDGWVSNEISFDDERVVGAIETFGTFIRNDDYVVGGSEAAATTDFRDSPGGLFNFPPDCYMHRQASFIP